MNFFLILLLHFSSITFTSLKLQIKFYKYRSFNIPNSYGLGSFVNYFIENIYSTEILIGEPPQKIHGFLNPDQSAFYLTNKTCLSKRLYNSEKSSNYKFIENKVYKYYSVFRFSDSLSFDNITNSETNKCTINNYEFFVDCNITEYLCCIVGTKLASIDTEIEDNLLSKLHKNKNIKSYYFSFDIKDTREDELLYTFGIEEKDINGYTFIKTSSYTSNKRQNLVWGLNFEKIIFENDIIYEDQLRAEFNINLGCILGSTAFKSVFNSFLRNNNIIEILSEYNQKYYIYEFDEKYYDKLKNFTIDFYQKELDFHFILNYQDLFFEKYGKIYCLIVFTLRETYFWKFGLPFFRKYKFIYNQDTKIIGFFNSNSNVDDMNNNNIINNNVNGDKKYFKINFKIIAVVVLFLIFIIVGMIFFGILIGKKMYRVRKNKTNELLELYDYNSKKDNNN